MLKFDGTLGNIHIAGSDTLNGICAGDRVSVVIDEEAQMARLTSGDKFFTIDPYQGVMNASPLGFGNPVTFSLGKGYFISVNNPENFREEQSLVQEQAEQHIVQEQEKQTYLYMSQNAFDVARDNGYAYFGSERSVISFNELAQRKDYDIIVAENPQAAAEYLERYDIENAYLLDMTTGVKYDTLDLSPNKDEYVPNFDDDGLR